MATANLNTTIESMFATAWGSTTSIKYDNVPFTIPSASWVDIQVWDGMSTKASLGSGVQRRRSTGTVFIGIYTAVDAGSRPARLLADAVVAIFRDKQVSGVTFEEPDVVRLGEVSLASSTTPWYQMKVAVPFVYDVFA